MDRLVINGQSPLRGVITVPGDKSISHRALLLGAIARGTTLIGGFLPSADCLATVRCLEQLGVLIERPDETTVRVRGGGLRGFTEPADCLDCGNSGTTLRLLAGLLAGQDGYAVLTGDDSLCRRPMARITEPLRRMGATVLGRQEGRLPPLTIRGGRLRGIEYALPVASAQVKSSLLLAGLYADSPVTLHEPAPSRDHTERLLRAQGVDLQSVHLPFPVLRLQPPTADLLPLTLTIPGDLSAAAFFLVAATLLPGSHLQINGVGVNPGRTGILEVLTAMGGRVLLENLQEVGGEPRADLLVTAGDLRGIEIGGALIPRLIDELPVIAVAATQAWGETVVRDAAELRVKESDRITALVTGLRRLGAQIEERPDGFIVVGPTPLHGDVVESQGDHRLAMALAVAGLVARGQTTILGADAIPVSFPDFAETLVKVTTPDTVALL